MHKVAIQTYVRLGMSMQGAIALFWFVEREEDQTKYVNALAAYAAQSSLSPPAKVKIVEKMDAADKEEMRDTLTAMRDVCKELGLTTSETLLTHSITDLPATTAEFRLLRIALFSEIHKRLFLFVPADRAPFYEKDDILSQGARDAFPSAYRELRSAGNCYATAEFTACVFHLMRAAELGVRALGTALDVTFPTHPIELADWQNILDQADAKITAMKNLPKGTHKDEELNFYSQAGIQFRYFKDGWRVRVAHARETYSENQALTIMRHTCEFFEVIASRLKE